MTVSNITLVLLDVEGTVSPLAFVHETLFPFARRELAAFLAKYYRNEPVEQALEQLAVDAGAPSFASWCPYDVAEPQAYAWVIKHVQELMDNDAKTTGLKLLQGLIWEQGYLAGKLRSTIFSDVAPAFEEWRRDGLELRIYSSGSVHAQRLFFAHTDEGDLTPYLSGYHDTTSGPKRACESYRTISQETRHAASQILFLSDVPEELDAAREAGYQTAWAVRPGNRTVESSAHPSITSLSEIEFV